MCLVCLLQVLLLAATPNVDNWAHLRLWALQTTHPAAAFSNIGVSCAMAVLINWSTTRVLAISTPVTYHILGHSKTCLNVVVGYVLFGARIDLHNMFGVVLAMLGLVAYRCARQRNMV